MPQFWSRQAVSRRHLAGICRRDGGATRPKLRHYEARKILLASGDGMRHTSHQRMMSLHRERSSDLVQGTLDMLILRTLARGRAHGYAVAESIHQKSEDVLRVEESALYPALHRLELHGLLSSEWGISENRRRAKYYRLTARGRRYLETESAHWDRMTAAIARVMDKAVVSG
jgi:PadR family transcriptional regulator, regulatory protein PadR